MLTDNERARANNARRNAELRNVANEMYQKRRRAAYPAAAKVVNRFMRARQAKKGGSPRRSVSPSLLNLNKILRNKKNADNERKLTAARKMVKRLGDRVRAKRKADNERRMAAARKMAKRLGDRVRAKRAAKAASVRKTVPASKRMTRPRVAFNSAAGMNRATRMAEALTRRRRQLSQAARNENAARAARGEQTLMNKRLSEMKRTAPTYGNGRVNNVSANVKEAYKNLAQGMRSYR
jgi:hypothetical protein